MMQRKQQQVALSGNPVKLGLVLSSAYAACLMQAAMDT